MSWRARSWEVRERRVGASDRTRARSSAWESSSLPGACCGSGLKRSGWCASMSFVSWMLDIREWCGAYEV
jgi:hypothetical protein